MKWKNKVVFSNLVKIFERKYAIYLIRQKTQTEFWGSNLYFPSTGPVEKSGDKIYSTETSNQYYTSYNRETICKSDCRPNLVSVFFIIKVHL